jgi:hypothetical protein
MSDLMGNRPSTYWVQRSRTNQSTTPPVLAGLRFNDKHDPDVYCIRHRQVPYLMKKVNMSQVIVSLVSALVLVLSVGCLASHRQMRGRRFLPRSSFRQATKSP